MLVLDIFITTTKEMLCYVPVKLPQNQFLRFVILFLIWTHGMPLKRKYIH